MANKRMFSMNIVDSDAFLDMPLSTQCLYFHLNMRADDDGFISSPKRVMKLISATEDDLKLLIAKNFVLTFESGVIVIKHWRIHNTLSKGRYHETMYLEEKSTMLIKDNGSYSFTEGNEIDDSHLLAENKRRTSGEQTENLEKNRIEENSKEKQRKEEINILFNTLWEMYPRKEGKSAISDSKKKEIYKIGYEKMSKAILKYSKEVEGREKQYILQGSTFFRTRYVDYLPNDDEIVDVENTKPINEDY